VSARKGVVAASGESSTAGASTDESSRVTPASVVVLVTEAPQPIARRATTT